jgi:tetratricopeptide (TPR) repeat protein
MRPRYRTWLWLLLLGLAPQAGCVTLKESTSPNTTPQEMPAADQSKDIAYFYDRDAEKLCLLTAQKYEEHDPPCYGEAAAQLEKARTLNPKLNVSLRLAKIYEQLGDYPRALAEYNKELALTKKNDADLLNGILAGLKKMVGQPTMSNDAFVLNDIGRCLYLKGDWAGSERYLNESLEKNPLLDSAWLNLSLTLAAQNRLEESVNAGQRVVSESDAYANAAFVLLMRVNKFDEAKQAYRKALELNPDNAIARRVLTEMLDGEKKVTAPGQPG